VKPSKTAITNYCFGVVFLCIGFVACLIFIVFGDNTSAIAISALGLAACCLLLILGIQHDLYEEEEEIKESEKGGK
jgi:hypothetical protein